MKNPIKQCRVCGKNFIPCRISETELEAFNYKSICCSAECGAEYFEQVRIAREEPQKIVETKPKKSKKDKVEVEPVVIENDNVVEMPLKSE